MLREELREKTKGANEIQLTQAVLSEIQREVASDQYFHFVKNSKIYLAIKSPFGFWMWKENGVQKDHCDPDDWIVIEPNEGQSASISFKKQAQLDAMQLAPFIVPTLSTECVFHSEKT